MRADPEDDFDLIRRCLEELCKQLPEGANCNPAARILQAIDRLEKADIDRWGDALERGEHD